MFGCSEFLRALIKVKKSSLIFSRCLSWRLSRILTQSMLAMRLPQGSGPNSNLKCVLKPSRCRHRRMMQSLKLLENDVGHYLSSSRSDLVNKSCVKHYRFCPRLFYTLSCTLSGRLNFQRISQAVIYQHVGVADLSCAQLPLLAHRFATMFSCPFKSRDTRPVCGISSCRVSAS